jgi:hypothetical protein
MIYQANTITAGGPTRALVLPRNGPIFGYFWCYLQINGPNTIIIGSSREEAGRNNNGIVQDGLQFTQANTNNGAPTPFLWRGELWIAGSAPNTQVVIVVPGLESDNTPCDQTTAATYDSDL